MHAVSTQQHLKNCFQNYIGCQSHISHEFTSLFQLKTYRKHQMYLHTEQKWDQFTIVVSGLFRLYYLDSEGKEHTKGFFYEGQILAPCAPQARHHPVNFSIECLEPAQVLTGPYAMIRQRLEATQWGLHLLITMLETIFSEKVEREYAFMTLDAEARYHDFIQQHPALFNRLPLYLVANYLGMTDVTLSRIRKKSSRHS